MQKFGLFMLLLVFVSCMGAPAQNFTANFNDASFLVSRGDTSGRVLIVCGENGFFGKVSVSLEGAPTGISLTFPDSKEFTAIDCPTTLGNALQPLAVVPAPVNFILSASSTAVLGNDLTFKVVLKSSNVTKKLDVTITITDPVAGG
jgi:hypothetical protein